MFLSSTDPLSLIIILSPFMSAVFFGNCRRKIDISVIMTRNTHAHLCLALVRRLRAHQKMQVVDQIFEIVPKTAL